MTKHTTRKEGIRIYRKNFPKDVYDILLRKQAEIKISCNCQFSIEQTIYKLIRASSNIPVKPE